MLLDCNIEYKKGENQTDIQLENETDYEAVLKLEEDWVQKTCEEIIAHKPDLIITEKGVSGTYYFRLIVHNDKRFATQY